MIDITGQRFGRLVAIACLYGGRGISVCARWNESFENFILDVGKRPQGTSLDRIDNARNYEPGNVRWATPHEQSRNKRSNRMITVFGETLCLQDCAAKYNMSVYVLSGRLKRGWEIEKAVTVPVKYSKSARKNDAASDAETTSVESLS